MCSEETKADAHHDQRRAKQRLCAAEMRKFLMLKFVDVLLIELLWPTNLAKRTLPWATEMVARGDSICWLSSDTGAGTVSERPKRRLL